MQSSLRSKTPSCQRQFLVTREIGLHHGWVWPAGMQIDRHIERLGTFENAPEPLLIQETVSASAVDHRALEAEAADCAVHLLHGGRRLVGGQCGKSGEAIR